MRFPARLPKQRTRAMPVMLLASSVALGFGTAVVSASQPAPPAERLQQLESDLQHNDSATLTLERWCETNHLAADPRVHAERLHDADKPADAGIRRSLQVDGKEPLRYRHVRLRCGGVALSDADNWYVPARLSPQMNAILDSTDEPFGRVVLPLHYRRVRLGSERPWPAADAERRLATLPEVVLVQRALLALPDGRPISYVVESYRREAIAPPVN